VVADEGRVEDDREPFSGDEEEQIEEDVQDVLGQHQRVQAVALVDRVLVVGLQFVESDNLKLKPRSKLLFRTFFIEIFLISKTFYSVLK
jgi:hypothetical protein